MHFVRRQRFWPVKWESRSGAERCSSQSLILTIFLGATASQFARQNSW